MLVLRFTTQEAEQGRNSTEIETPRTELLVGSDPLADVTLQGAGLAPRAIQLKVEGNSLRVADLSAGRSALLVPGNEITIGKLAIKLVALPKPDPAGGMIFGSYDDDPVVPPSSRPHTDRPFELTEAGSQAATPAPAEMPKPAEKPAAAPASSPPLPRADEKVQPEVGLGDREKAQIHAAAAAAAAAELLANSEAAARKRAVAKQQQAARRQAAKQQAAQQAARRKAAAGGIAAGGVAAGGVAAGGVAASGDTAKRAAASNAAASHAAARELARKMTSAEKAAMLKRVKFSEPNFGEALFTQLKRAPFFAFSVAFHALIFLILSLISSTETRPELQDGPGAIVASMNAEDEQLAEEVPEAEEDLGLPQVPSELPDLPELEDAEDKPPDPNVPIPSPFREDMERLKDEENPPMDIGVMPSLHAATSKARQRKPKMPKVDLQRVFNKGAAGSSNQQSADIVRAQLGSGRGGKANKLDRLQAEDVLVVKGAFDHIAKVLDALRIKYVHKTTYGLYSPRLEDFSRYKVIFWNCGEAMNKRRMEALGKRLQRFVRNGGYLFTTDWGVANVLPYAFPGYLKTRGNAAHLPEMVLPIEPAPEARDHPLLEGVFHRGTQGKWWLEQASFDLAAGRKDAVTILIQSPVLQSTFNRSPAVAATFNYGRGRVLHALGHYYQEAGNLAGTLSAHRLALNFVLMRLDQDKDNPLRRETRDK